MNLLNFKDFLFLISTIVTGLGIVGCVFYLQKKAMDDLNERSYHFQAQMLDWMSRMVTEWERKDK